MRLERSGLFFFGGPYDIYIFSKVHIENQNISKRTACYARVSTGNQGTGPETQVRSLRNYCQQREINDFLLFQDENQSGVKSSRPAPDKMIKAVRNKEIDRIIVYSFSRYIVSSEDHMIPPSDERAFAAKAKSVRFKIKASHAVYISHPSEVAKVIEKAASK